MKLIVSEIVSSLQGESSTTGYPTTFVRLFGCNLNCEYCDTVCTRKQGRSVETILSIIRKMGNKHVCITGGEPLLQDNVYVLIYDLVERGYKISIETNGSIPIDSYPVRRPYTYVMDIKCPSSKESSRNLYSNLENLQCHDEVKFVIKDIDDFMFAKKVINKYYTKAKLIFSPCFDKEGKSNAKWLAEKIIEEKIPKVRLGMQLHKIIGIY